MVAPGRDALWRVDEAEVGVRKRFGRRLKDVYGALAPSYDGRATAPLLVDLGGEGRIVSNESADILRVLPRLVGAVGPVQVVDGVCVWLRPESGVDLAELGELCSRVYEDVNDGVYRCGFAVSQAAYDDAEARLFRALDEMEARLRATRFLMSPTVITEADVRLYPTVFRLDAVYAGIFRTARKSIALDYPAIAGWLRDMYNLPGVRETCCLDATRASYYSNLFPLNPSGIVPRAPEYDFNAPHGREGLGGGVHSVPIAAAE